MTDGKILLSLARGTIAAAFGAPPNVAPDAPWLQQPGATFVTLTNQGELRGCIGTLEAYRPLQQDVCQNALAAAFRDPRFPPLQANELDETKIEISRLSPQHPILFTDEADALRQLRPHVDGIVLQAGHHRSTFLPQVWEQLPTPHEFLAHLKRKAGLAHDYWSPDVRLYRYTVEKWKE